MKKTIARIRRFFSVEYRMTAIFAYGGWEDYKGSRKWLRELASRLYPVEHWSIYKKGPFNLPEKEIDSKAWHEQWRGRL